ncbi:unnamed protein product [Leptosia nina]|uniref:Uncharacterized protein n=1 Tax=Leptosia nina TaxID=320188 RepID=A0AAV1K6S6_9NEOP
MKKTPPSMIHADCDAGESSTQESDNVNTKLRQRKKVARDENDDFLVLRNEMKEWLRTFQRELNAKLDKLRDQQNSRLEAMEGCIAELSSKLSTVNETSQSIENSIEFVSTKIEGMQGKIDNFQKNIIALSAQLVDLEEKHEALDRAIHKTTIEIRNVPKQSQPPSKAELFAYLTQLASSLQIDFSTSDIRDVARFTNRKDNSTWNLTVDLCN